jgi:hypothetical protein
LLPNSVIVTFLTHVTSGVLHNFSNAFSVNIYVDISLCIDFTLPGFPLVPCDIIHGDPIRAEMLVNKLRYCCCC